MIETVASYNSFWLIISIVIIIAIVTIGIVIRGKSGDKKDTFIFAKSSDNAKEVTIDTTEKMKEIALPKQYETELHQLETDVKDHTDRINRIEQIAQDLNDKFDLIIERMIKLENK